MKNKKLNKGEIKFRRDNNLLMLRYQEKKEVYFLSTIHDFKSANTGKKKCDGMDQTKPVWVNDYNKYMGGIDRNDAMMGNYSSVRKSLKWTTKVSDTDGIFTEIFPKRQNETVLKWRYENEVT